MQLARKIALLWAFSLILIIAGDATAPACADLKTLQPVGNQVLCCCNTFAGQQCCGLVAYCSNIVPGCPCTL